MRNTRKNYLKALKNLKKNNFVENYYAKSLTYFYKGKQKNIINKKLINSMIYISKHLKQNLRLNLHFSKEDKLHNMVILQRKDIKLNTHKHLKKNETIHLIRGKIKIIIFDNNHKKKFVQLLDKENFMFKIPCKFYHTIDIVSNYAIYHESKVGPFSPNQTINY